MAVDEQQQTQNLISPRQITFIRNRMEVLGLEVPEDLESMHRDAATKLINHLQRQSEQNRDREAEKEAEEFLARASVKPANPQQ